MPDDWNLVRAERIRECLLRGRVTPDRLVEKVYGEMYHRSRHKESIRRFISRAIRDLERAGVLRATDTVAFRVERVPETDEIVKILW